MRNPGVQSRYRAWAWEYGTRGEKSGVGQLCIIMCSGAALVKCCLWMMNYTRVLFIDGKERIFVR